MAASYNKFLDFVEQLGLGKHQLETDVFKAMLTNVAPVNTNTIKANITDIAAGFGYTAGGNDVVGTYSEAAGVGSFAGTDVVWTAAGGSIGAFRYVVLYNDSQTTPAKPLVGWWDYGSAITILDGETFTVDFGATILTVT